MAPHNRSGFFTPRKPSFRRPLHGFTLVELLVVVVIISMLAALMLPALIGARGRARIAQCVNNQKEIAKAVQQYEIAKKRMPGYINRLGAHAVSWVPVLFPYLGRTDLWEDAGGWRGFIQDNPMPQPQSVRVSQLVCPDADSTDPCALTYVVNVGLAYDSSAQANNFVNKGTSPFTPLTSPGVFRNMVPMDYSGTPVQPKPLSMTDIKSSSQRPMLSERQYPLSLGTGDTLTERVWNSYTPALAANARESDLTPSGVKLTPAQLGFRWQPYLPTDSTLITAPFLPPTTLPQTTIHRGIVIVTFCDGHTESLADNVECNVYDSSPIP